MARVLLPTSRGLLTLEKDLKLPSQSSCPYVSNVRLALVVEPMYVNWQTNSISYSPMAMTGSAFVSCPMMIVFFRLIVSPESLLFWEKRSVRDWSSCQVWIATAASSPFQYVSDPRVLLSHVWFGRGRRACHLIGYAGDDVSKAISNSIANKIPCLTLLRMSNGSGELPLNCTFPFMSMRKDSVMLCSLCWQPITKRGHLCWPCQMT